MFNIGYCVWVVPLNDKKDITTTNPFQKFLGESNRKPNKIWVDKNSEVYNRSTQSWLQDNGIEMYWTHKENLLLLKNSLEP